MPSGETSGQVSGIAPTFRVPEESCEHERTFMQWPANGNIHRNSGFLAALQDCVAKIANSISAFESVVMLMDGENAGAARRKLSARVEIWPIPTDDLWCRDSGPMFAVDGHGRMVVSQLRFNGWGGKQSCPNDSLIAARVAERLGLPLIDSGLVGEAGGIETDGEGTLLAHESCWINPNRNRGTKSEINARLLAAFGAQKILWAPGIRGADITDSHIDALARFVRPGCMLIQLPDRPDHRDKWSKVAHETEGLPRNHDHQLSHRVAEPATCHGGQPRIDSQLVGWRTAQL